MVFSQRGQAFAQPVLAGSSPGGTPRWSLAPQGALSGRWGRFSPRQVTTSAAFLAVLVAGTWTGRVRAGSQSLPAHLGRGDGPAPWGQMPPGKVGHCPPESTPTQPGASRPAPTAGVGLQVSSAPLRVSCVPGREPHGDSEAGEPGWVLPGGRDLLAPEPPCAAGQAGSLGGLGCPSVSSLLLSPCSRASEVLGGGVGW